MAQTELAYLLYELENWDEDKPIQVKNLKRMIEKSFLRRRTERMEDEQNIQSQSSMDEIDHD
jgi:hypothetical protein